MVSRSIFLAAIIASPGWAQAPATPSVTLAEAVRRAERVQPAVIGASADVRTAAAQRRSAWGAYLPRVSASSSGSDFFSEGPARIDPITGELTSDN